MTLKHWLYGLCSAIITSIATAGTATISAAAFDITLNLKQLLITCGCAGLIGALAYLKQSPLPPEDVDIKPKPSGFPQSPLIVLALIISLVSACAPTTPSTGSATPPVTVVDQAAAWLSDSSNQKNVHDGLVITGKLLLSKYGGDDRQTIANQMYTAANAFNSLASGDLITVEQVNATVKTFLEGEDPSKYSEFTDEANLVWQIIYSKLQIVKDPSLIKAWLVLLADAAQKVGESNQ